MTSKQLQEKIHNVFKIKYHITHVRKIMHKLNFSAKTVKCIHVNRANMAEIKKWQRNTKRRILRLEQDGFTITVYDESIFIDEPQPGSKY